MTKNKLLILIAIIISIILIFSNKEQAQNIPEEDLESKIKLQKAIDKSNFDLGEGINELENLKDLSDYTEYKKNYILGKLYTKKDETEKAIKIFEDIKGKNYPLKERVLFHLGKLYSKLGDDTLAIKYYTNIIDKIPDSPSVPQAAYFLAQTQLRLRLNDKAIKTLITLNSRHPNTQYGIATNFYLGEIAYHKNNFKDSLEFWRKYLRKSPDGRFADEIATIIINNPNINLTSKDYSLLGNVFYKKKKYDKAADFYLKANNTKYFYKLGYSLYRLERKNEAIIYFTKYAYNYPDLTNSRWALFYSAACKPLGLRKQFWESISKDIPELKYYSMYKEAVLENIPSKKEEKFKAYIKNFPGSDFTLNVVWELVWKKFKEKQYIQAEEIGKVILENTKDKSIAKSESWIKVAFWLGKIAEITNDKTKAASYYKLAKSKIPDNYYSYRAKHRLSALNNSSDQDWSQQRKVDDYDNFIWYIPEIVKSETIKKHFGICVLELIKLKEYNEAIELIGKNTYASKRLTSWLKALNNEHEESINIANSLLRNYDLNANSKLWELSYPLYYWSIVFNTCKKYKNMDPLFVFGIIRQESKFAENALSISDAYGLMQLISPTAKTVARQINITLNSTSELYNPKINISLGIHYLNSLLSEFSNPVFAVASYNAGPQATKRWLVNIGTKDIDVFIEEVPYEQTRDYIKKVYESYWSYLSLYRV